MTIARGEIVSEVEEGSYHCVSRCVRRAYLCGADGYSGRNYDHRKGWIRDRLKHLSQYFPVDVLGYAVMDNHCHVIVRVKPEEAQGWTAREVASRWLMVYPGRRLRKKRDAATWEREVAAIVRDPQRVEELRCRLGSLSWFMRGLNEYIARRANKEDECTGRFWEGRFKCRALLDEGALLTCLTYVDLNPIRAGVAERPEESEYTSVYDRVRSLGEESIPAVERSDAWLSPLQTVGDRRGVFSKVSLEEYLRLLDATGRAIHRKKSGTIPDELAPILERLAIDQGYWTSHVDRFEDRYRRVVGRVSSVTAKTVNAGKNWFQGINACRELFT